MPESRFYDEHEAEQILQIAARDSMGSGAMTRERLVATAAELGIPEDAIVRAEQQLAAQREEEARKKEEAAEFKQYKADRRRRAFSSLGGWVSTSILLVGLDLLTSGKITWSIWPVGIWGLIELGNVVKSLTTPSTDGERFERWRQRRRRRLEG